MYRLAGWLVFIDLVTSDHQWLCCCCNDYVLSLLVQHIPRSFMLQNIITGDETLWLECWFKQAVLYLDDYIERLVELAW